jgi:hypothetical protein
MSAILLCAASSASVPRPEPVSWTSESVTLRLGTGSWPQSKYLLQKLVSGSGADWHDHNQTRWQGADGLITVLALRPYTTYQVQCLGPLSI